MSNPPPVIDYEAKPRASRPWGLSRPVWLLIAVFCATVEYAGAFATNGRVNGPSDIAFIVVFAVVGLVALANSLRPLRQPEQPRRVRVSGRNPGPGDDPNHHHAPGSRARF